MYSKLRGGQEHVWHTGGCRGRGGPASRAHGRQRLPKAAQGRGISALSRVAAVADVYDALISERPHRAAYFPDEAWDYIMSNSGVLFDAKVAAAFSETVAKYLPGDAVLLSDGREALVRKIPRPYAGTRNKNN